MNKDFLYKDISYQIRGACFWIWKEFGNAFKESILDNALTEELRKRSLKVETQKRINIFYEGKEVGVYIPDKIINDCILVETKSKPFLTNKDIKQFWHYLKGTKYKVGFLINFGEKGLEIKRVVYDLARKKDLCEDPRNRSASRSAFTLIEMLVAMAIFSTVMGIITGIFITGIQQQKMALDSQVVLDQTSYALEYMSRALRFAKKQLAGDPLCLSVSGLNVETTRGGLSIKFINHLQDDDCQEFFLENNQIKYRRKIGQLEENTLPLTSVKLEVTSLKFDLAGEYQDDDLQPRITIFSEIKSAGASGQSQKIQTSISQRNLDVTY